MIQHYVSPIHKLNAAPIYHLNFTAYHINTLQQTVTAFHHSNFRSISSNNRSTNILTQIIRYIIRTQPFLDQTAA